MAKLRHLLLILPLLFLAACRSQTRPTPTADTTVLGVGGEPLAVTVEDLAANPSLYAGNFVQVSGAYQRLPRLVCEGETFPAPATWSLAFTDMAVKASGFDAQLRPLIPDGLTMTVVGRWQQWQGEVGCGKNVREQAIWYLEVSGILSPSPITQVTLTPPGGDGDATSEMTMAEDGTAVAATSPTNTPELSVMGNDDITTPTRTTATPTTIGGAQVGTATPTPTATPDDGETVTATATRTPRTAVSGSATPTTTSTPTRTGTAVATNTPRPGETNTPRPTLPAFSSPTATGTTAQEFNMGPIYSDEIEPIIETLSSDEVQVWTFFNFETNNVMEISVGAETGMNMVLTVVDPDGQTVIVQDESGANEIERIADADALNLTKSGEYLIKVGEVNGVGGEYAIVIQDNDSAYPIILEGILQYGDTRPATIPADTDQYWLFTGAMNDRVTVTVDAVNADSLSAELIRNYSLIVPEGDPPYDPASGVTYQLNESGLYLLWMFEATFSAASYQISLEQN